MSLKNFSLSYVLYGAAVGGGAIFLSSLFPDISVLTEKFWLVFGFLFGITYIAYILAFLGINRNPQTGIMAIMGSITMKLLFSMAFVLIYSLNHKEKGMVFVLNFFSLYLLFTVFEIYTLLRNLRHQNKK